MKLRATKIDRRFIPEFNGNRDLPANEQMVILFQRIPGTSEAANYRGFKFDQGGAIQLYYNDNLLVSSLVQKIDNLEIGGERIKTGAELAVANCPALSALFAEIRNYLFPENEELSEGESQA